MAETNGEKKSVQGSVSNFNAIKWKNIQRENHRKTHISGIILLQATVFGSSPLSFFHSVLKCKTMPCSTKGRTFFPYKSLLSNLAVTILKKDHFYHRSPQPYVRRHTIPHNAPTNIYVGKICSSYLKEAIAKKKSPFGLRVFHTHAHRHTLALYEYVRVYLVLPSM